MIQTSIKIPTLARGFTVVFGFAFMAMGLAFCCALAWFAYGTLTPRTWNKTPCRITESRVEGVRDKYRLEVVYHYSYDGEHYSSDLYQRQYSGHPEVGKADQLAERYAAGTEHTCFVNPQDPSQAVLSHAFPFVVFFAAIPLVFVAIGGAIVWTAITGGKVSTSTPISGDIDSNTLPVGGRVALALFFSTFLLMGLGVGYGVFLRPILRSIDARNWVDAPCTIVSSKVGEHSGGDGSTYSIDILYRYDYGGVEYRSNRYSFFTGSSSGFRGKADVVALYPAGAEASCYVDPSNPHEAVLSRRLGAGTGVLFGLIPLVFVAVGIGGIAAAVRGRIPGRRLMKERANVRMSQTQRAGPSGTGGPPDPSMTGPVDLKPESGRVGKIIVLVVFCAIWDTVVFFMVKSAVAGFQRGRPEYMLVVFCVVFGVAGVIMFALLVYQFLAVFNPLPLVQLEHGAAHLGDTVRMRWRFKGNVARMRELIVTFEGKEEATYRRGTSRQTDTHVFHGAELFRSSAPADMRRGVAELTVPADSMHSFRSPNNAITWHLRFSGDIPRWPDLKEEFTVEVLPFANVVSDEAESGPDQ